MKMNRAANDMEGELQELREGRATLDQVRSLPPKLAALSYASGIPVWSGFSATPIRWPCWK
jgi:hypothetical protein